MGCRKITYYQAGEANGQTAFFSGGGLEKKESALKNRYNYYPFGLTFNSYKREFSKVNKMNTFQDQEYDEETGWVQFKWRNHMPELGRFFNVDPLAEDYYYNSPYAFAENKLGRGIELEGLELFREAFTAEYMAVKASLKSSSNAIGNLVRGSDNPNEASRRLPAVDNKTMNIIDNSATIANNVSENTAKVSNKIAKDGLDGAKIVGTTLELTGVGTKAGMIINGAAEGLDQARQVFFEGKNIEDAAYDAFVDISISVGLGSVADKAKDASRTVGTFAEGEGKVHDAVIDLSTKGKEVLIKKTIESSTEEIE